jgi:hypothetical protein
VTRRLWPWAVVAAITVATALELHLQGRDWICTCGIVLPWTSNAWSSDTSQHLFDPYSFTHVLHGFAFCGLLALLLPRTAASWRFVIAIALESLWEIIENTNTVIDRYREATAALGYHGDSVVNSVGDIIACALGFWVARQLGWKRSIVVFIMMEAVLLVWIRDSLLLEILMLIHPIEAIKRWQGSP